MKHNHSISYFVFAVFILFFFTGCIEEFDDDNIPQSQSSMIVVNGSILGDTVCEINLTYTQKLKEDTVLENNVLNVKNVNNAKVRVLGTDGSEYLPIKWYVYEKESLLKLLGDLYNTMEFSDMGRYIFKLPKLNPDVAYYLRIESNGDVYESEPQKPIRTPEIDTIEYCQNAEESDVNVMITTEKPENTDRIMYYEWNVGETWEVRPVFKGNYRYNSKENIIEPIPDKEGFPKRGWKIIKKAFPFIESTAHYKDQQFQKYRIYGINCDDERIYYNYSGLITQRAISKDEYEYQLASNQASLNMGGLFSPQASALPTNIRCVKGSRKALGFVGVSLNRSEKRFYIDGEKISKILPPRPIITNTDIDMSIAAQYWFSGSRIIANGDGHISWVNEKYVDLRTRKDLTFDKPYYMP